MRRYSITGKYFDGSEYYEDQLDIDELQLAINTIKRLDTHYMNMVRQSQIALPNEYVNFRTIVIDVMEE